MSDSPPPPEPTPSAPEPILDPSQPSGSPPEPPRVSPFTILLQFFIIPVGIVVACGAVFLGLRMLIASERTPDELLDEVESGSINRRWQAAYELSQVLARENRPKTDSAFTMKAISAFEASKMEDHKIREYLALILGSLRERSVTRPLLEALPDASDKLRFNILLSLGALEDPAARPALLKALDDPADAGVRKVALLGLSRLPKDEEVLSAFRVHLTDSAVDVKWNAALFLAWFNDPSGSDVLLQMLDRSYLERETTDAKPDQVTSSLLIAVSASARLYSERFRVPLTALSTGDKDATVRERAKEALEWLDQRK